MDSTHVSERIWIRLEGDETVLFSNDSIVPSYLPTEEQLRKKITGVQLSCPFYGKQSFGIEPLERAFGASSNGIIQKIPNELTLDMQDDVVILKYGSTCLSPRIISIAKTVGMSGYWDDSNLIICSSKVYEPIIENVIDFLQPQKVAFVFTTIFGWPNLMIIN